MDEKDDFRIVNLFEDVRNLTRDHDREADGKGAITLWVPTEYKVKYEELQDRTDRKFGKKAKELLYLLIDKAISN